MALDAGRLTITLEYAQGLRDKDILGRQDPYVRLLAGGQQYRSRTAVDGGRNPVWNQTFQLSIINENGVELELWDADTFSRDDLIGTAFISLAKARMYGADHIQAPVISKHRRRQHGFISVALRFERNPTTPYYQAPHPAPYPAAHQTPAYSAPAYAQPGYAPVPAPAHSYAQGAIGGHPPAGYPYTPPPQLAYASAPYTPSAAPTGYYPSLPQTTLHYPPGAPAPPPPPISFY